MKKKNKNKKAVRESIENLAFLDECFQVRDVEILVTEKWNVVTIPISLAGLQGEKDKQIANYLESELPEFNRYFFTGDKEKGKRYFLPSRNCCIVRLSSEIMKSKKSQKIEYIKNFLNTVHSPEGLIGKELTITPREIIKKFKSGHSNNIEYRQV